MRSSSKSRNRGRNANRRGNNGGSIINRVFESAGPEGKVRGTPQQIIDKYISLAHDSQLSGDRVSAENFQQHAEHYSRILSEAQKELIDKQVETFSANSLNPNKNENLIQENSKSEDLEKDIKNDKAKNINVENFEIKKDAVSECSPEEQKANIHDNKLSKSKKDILMSDKKNNSDKTILDL